MTTDIRHTLFLAIVQDFYTPLSMPMSMTMDPTDNATYEELTDLCERLGDVKIGVPDIHDISTIIVVDTRQDTCPICLEVMPQPECIAIRKLTACSHKFCSSCIETWLSHHKTCPVCKMDVTQIPSMAASPSADSPNVTY